MQRSPLLPVDKYQNESKGTAAHKYLSRKQQGTLSIVYKKFFSIEAGSVACISQVITYRESESYGSTPTEKLFTLLPTLCHSQTRLTPFRLG